MLWETNKESGWKGVCVMLAKRFVFLSKFMRNPQKIGSLTPSSAFLTRKLLLKLPWDRIDSLVELGAGTGVFTEFIAAHKEKKCQVFVVEQDDTMREVLQCEYPKFHFGNKAEQLNEMLDHSNIGKVDCIVSGLPFATFSEELRKEILRQITKSLRAGGVFVAFQYSLQMHKLLKSHFKEVKVSFELLNMPPAFVYRCKK